MLKKIVLFSCLFVAIHGRYTGNYFHPYNYEYLDNQYLEGIRFPSESKHFINLVKLLGNKGGAAMVYAIRGYKLSCSDGMSKIRDAYGDPHLLWDESLAIEAEKKAITIAETGIFSHSNTAQGENLFGEMYIDDADRLQRLSCSFPLWSWYSERSEPPTERGHLLQMIGERVKRFGIGVAVNINTRMIYAVGRFDYNMPSQGADLIKYMESKERWVIPNRERLVSERGQLTSIPQ